MLILQKKYAKYFQQFPTHIARLETKKAEHSQAKQIEPPSYLRMLTKKRLQLFSLHIIF
jgi:hypothetical protein